MVPTSVTGCEEILALEVAGVLASGSRAPAMQWRCIGQRYQDERRVVASVELNGTHARLTFELPATAVVADHLHLVPAALPGEYAIDCARVDGRVVADLGRRLMAVDGDRLDAAPGCLRWRNWMRAPSLELDVRGLEMGTRLEFLLRREGEHEARDALAHGLQAIVREQARAEARLSDGQLAQSVQLAELAAVLARGFVDVRAAYQESFESSFSDVARRHETALLKAMIEAQAKRLETLQSTLDRVVLGVENVFWRRWLRQLRRRAS